ncbi:STAS domain-containing protein [Spongiibacter sp. KMU-158]|uniref:STAS domain-containing protein n=1 Tax=Spongiibacter pelagi TaxID=2760804 RepID=A0A927C0V2_9GAMM|nr:STAS domain-containing protein [Spongiibacter pelagi]MBD2858128.1 STAS domain-containing protein [Spongiibacter pelagi]
MTEEFVILLGDAGEQSGAEKPAAKAKPAAKKPAAKPAADAKKGNEEFVILLGDEPEEKPAPKAEPKKAASKGSDEFVILLDDPAPVKKADSSDGWTYELGGEETIGQVKALHQKLMASPLDKVSEIIIDGSEVQNIDTSALQLLVYFTRYGTERGVNVSVVNPSAKMKGSVELLGYAPHLNIAA